MALIAWRACGLRTPSQVVSPSRSKSSRASVWGPAGARRQRTVNIRAEAQHPQSLSLVTFVEFFQARVLGRITALRSYIHDQQHVYFVFVQGFFLSGQRLNLDVRNSIICHYGKNLLI